MLYAMIYWSEHVNLDLESFVINYSVFLWNAFPNYQVGFRHKRSSLTSKQSLCIKVLEEPRFFVQAYLEQCVV